MSKFRAALDRQIGLEEYLVYSTIVAIMMSVSLKGGLSVGSVMVIVNTFILLTYNRLSIHTNHLIAICALTVFSLVGSHLSGTPLIAPLVQIAGITVMSVYFFNAIMTFGLSVRLWLDLYMRAAFLMALLAFLLWPSQHFGPGDPRLRAIYSEPSFYIYLMLPAVGYCINCVVYERRYWMETIVFLLSFAFAASSIGFIGLMLIGLFVYWPKFKGWWAFGGGLLFCLAVAGLYFVSEDFRGRTTDMVRAIITQDISSTGLSVFAILSNVYVAVHSFLAHPWTGVGLGGYANQFDIYFNDITGTAPGPNPTLEYFKSIQLNRDDASSMFLRVAAELGIPGIVLLVGFLIVCGRVRGTSFVMARNTLLPYLIMRMSRLGAYFTVEFYFFVGLYVLNYLSYRKVNGVSDEKSPEYVA